MMMRAGEDGSKSPGWATWALLGLFLASGATSLVYETLWARQLHLVFGTSQLAICTVLASFATRRALEAMRAARSLSPEDLAIQVQHQIYEREARRDAEAGGKR